MRRSGRTFILLTLKWGVAPKWGGCTEMGGWLKQSIPRRQTLYFNYFEMVGGGCTEMGGVI